MDKRSSTNSTKAEDTGGEFNMAHKYCLGYSARGGQIHGEANAKIVHVIRGKRTSGP